MLNLCLTVYIPTKYYLNISKHIDVDVQLLLLSAQALTDRCQADHYIPHTLLAGDKKNRDKYYHSQGTAIFIIKETSL